jgi:hypothetical protein
MIVEADINTPIAVFVFAHPTAALFAQANVNCPDEGNVILKIAALPSARASGNE